MAPNLDDVFNKSVADVLTALSQIFNSDLLQEAIRHPTFNGRNPSAY